MTPITVSVRELQTAVERKAYAYGVPKVISTLIGEYVVELMKELYAKPRQQRLVQKPTG